MTYPTNIANSTYTRIRPYLNVDGTPLVDAVCLKPCNDHVSKTSAAAFKEKCFCGKPVTAQEDDPIFQFYSEVMHQNAKLEIEIAKKNEEIFSLRERLQKQKDESDSHQKKYQDLQETVNKVFRTKVADKPQSPVIQPSGVNFSSLLTPLSVSPMEVIPPPPPSISPTKTEQKGEALSGNTNAIPKESDTNPAPKPTAPKRKETEAGETMERQSSAKVARDLSQAANPVMKAKAAAVTRQPDLKQPEKKSPEKDAEGKKKRVSKKTEKAKAFEEDSVKKIQPKSPSALMSPATKPSAIHYPTPPSFKPPAPKQKAPVDFTTMFQAKKPAETLAVQNVPVVQKAPAQTLNNLIVPQEIAKPAAIPTHSESTKPTEGKISSNVSIQTASLFAAPIHLTAPAETPEGKLQRSALNSQVNSVLARVLAKKTG